MYFILCSKMKENGKVVFKLLSSFKVKLFLMYKLFKSIFKSLKLTYGNDLLRLSNLQNF